MTSQGRNAVDPDVINRPVYHAPGVERHYLDNGIEASEALALLRVVAAFPHRDILDIGVGAGRTARYLAPLAARYESVDYSPVMVDYVRRNLPGISVHLGDMRDLSAFAADSFDVAFGSSNVIDAVSADDRLRVLAELRRVLRAGGIFLFSSHNRTYLHALGGPRLHLSKNPFTQLRNLSRYFVQASNHLKVRRYRREEPEFALLNDVGHDYSILHYYVDAATQQRQLERNGFRLVGITDRSPRFVTPEDDTSASGYLHYIAQKSA